jgi:hypothetical protein
MLPSLIKQTLPSLPNVMEFTQTLSSLPNVAEFPSTEYPRLSYFFHSRRKDRLSKAP